MRPYAHLSIAELEDLRRQILEDRAGFMASIRAGEVSITREMNTDPDTLLAEVLDELNRRDPENYPANRPVRRTVPFYV